MYTTQRPAPILTRFEMLTAEEEGRRLVDLALASALDTVIEHPSPTDGYREPDPIFAIACLELTQIVQPQRHFVLGRPPLFNEMNNNWQYYDIRTDSYTESAMNPEEFYQEPLEFIQEAFVNSYDCIEFYGRGANVERRHPADIAYFRHLLVERSTVIDLEHQRTVTPRNN